MDYYSDPSLALSRDDVDELIDEAMAVGKAQERLERLTAELPDAASTLDIINLTDARQTLAHAKQDLHATEMSLTKISDLEEE